MCAQILFHPLDAFDLIKRDRAHPPVLTLILICLAAAVCRVASVYLTHFPLNKNLPEDVNVLLLLAILFVPVFSWVIGSYSTTTLMGGEAKFSEALTGAIYCYVPYIVCTPILIGISYVCSTETAGLFNTLSTLVIVWMVILNFVAFMRLNDYGFLKGLFVAFIGIIAILLIWAVVILLFVFVYQVLLFFKELILEIKNQSLI